MLQDGDDNYVWYVELGRSQTNPKVSLFSQSPVGVECTGMTLSPDEKFMFMSVQHPSSENNSSIQYDVAGNAIAFDRDVVMVIARNEHLGKATNINSNELERVQVFPNPVVGTLSISGIGKENHPEISTLLGAKIAVEMNFMSAGLVINMEQLPKGLYLFSWVNKAGVKQTQKIIKQ